jgi:hypothetical protein
VTKDPTPLPESQFFYRRLFSYALSVVLLVFLGFIVWRPTDAKTLGDIAFWLIVLLWWVVTFYMVAPSAEQIARIISAAKLFRDVPDLAPTGAKADPTTGGANVKPDNPEGEG